jgi:hypothetical protein
MSISHAERRQIENEMIFRRINEKVGNDLDALDVLHEQEGNPELMRDQDLELDFKCECSDENCNTRIAVPLTEYQTIHENRDTFIVMPNHQVDPIEKILKSTSTYSVVVKNHSTAEPSDELNTTTIDNS